MNKIQKYREQFLEIKQNVKDTKLKNYFLGMLMTDLEKDFNISIIRDEQFNNANPVVMALYKDVSNERVL